MAIEEYARLGIEVDSTQAVRGLHGLDAATAKTTAGFTALNIAAAAMTTATIGFAAAVIRATTEQEAAVAQLQRGLDLSAGKVGRTMDQLVEQANRLQSTTLFSDDQINEAQSRLLSFQNVSGQVFDRAIEASADLAQRMGTDLNSALLQVGKALQEPVIGITALARSGTTFSAAQKEVTKDLVESGRLMEAQGLILDELERQYKGSAAAARDTFGGALKGLKLQIGELLEAGDGETLNDAKVAVQELTAAISDPAFVDGVAAIANGVVSFTASLVAMVAEIPRAIDFLDQLENAFVWGGESDDVAGIQIRIDALNKRLEHELNAARVFGQDAGQNPVVRQLREEIAGLEEQQRSLIDVQSQAIVKQREDTAAKAEAVQATTAHVEAMEKSGKATKAAQDAAEKLAEAREKERLALQAIVDAALPYQAKQRELIAQIATLDDAIRKETGSTESLQKARAKLQEQLSGMQSITATTIKGHADSVEELERELAALRQGEDAYKAYTEQLQIQEEAQRRINEVRDATGEITDAEIAQIEALTAAEIKLRNQIEEEAEARLNANRAWQGFITEIAGAFLSSTGNMGDAITDLLNRTQRELINSGLGALFGFETSSTPILSGLGQIFGGGKAGGLDMLFKGGALLPGAQERIFTQLGQLAGQPGMLGDIGTYLSNSAGRLAQSPGGLVGGGLLSAGAGFLGGQLGGAVFGGEAGLGSAAGGIGGALMGSQFGALGGPLGAFAGAFVGSAIDKVIGGDGPETRAAVFAGTDASRAEPKWIVDLQEAASGLRLAGEAQRVGPEGQEAVRTFTQALAGIDAALTASTRGAGFAVNLSGASFGAIKPGEEGARDFVRQWIDEVSRGFDAELEMAAATLGGESAQSLAAGFEALLNINARLDRGGEVFAGITSLSETIGLLQGRFADAGEGLGDTVARLDTAALLLALVGEQTDNTVAFFERASAALRGLGTQATDMIAYGQTLQRINDLLSEDRVLRDYEASTRTLYETYQAQTDAIEDLAANLEGAADFAVLEQALLERYDTELQLIGQIDSALQSVAASFNATIESIVVDGLESERERYEYFRAQADAVAQEILGLQDPAAIQQAAENYNRLVGQAYQSLSEESRDLLRDDILKTVTDMRELTTGLLEDLRGDVTGGGDVGAVIRSETEQALRTLREAVQAAVDAVAQQQQETSRQSTQLVAALNQWAANLPESIRVQIAGSEVAF